MAFYSCMLAEQQKSVKEVHTLVGFLCDILVLTLFSHLAK